MKKINYKEMYPVYVKKVAKKDVKVDSADAISLVLIDRINTHNFAQYIGIFDHYAHTKSIDKNEIGDDIQAAQNILFCFGKKLPDPKMLAVRPRSIGVCETNSHYVVSFLEAPNPALTKVMVDWVEEII